MKFCSIYAYRVPNLQGMYFLITKSTIHSDQLCVEFSVEKVKPPLVDSPNNRYNRCPYGINTFIFHPADTCGIPVVHKHYLMALLLMVLAFLTRAKQERALWPQPTQWSENVFLYLLKDHEI